MEYTVVPFQVPKAKLRMTIIDPTRRYGAHFHLQDTLADSLMESGAKRFQCAQFFLGGNASYGCRTLTKEDKDKSYEICQLYDKTFYIHCPYCANLAKPQDYGKSVEVVTKELQQISGLPGACVLHVGKVGTMANVCDRINSIKDQGVLQMGSSSRVPYPLLLESSAGQGTELGRSWEELRKLFEGLDHTCIGLCLDTQHLFGSGMSKLDSHESIAKMFDEADAIHPDGVSMFHLNDSAREFGSLVDRHAALLTGFIWGQSDDGLKALVKRCFDEQIDMISESSPAFDMAVIETKYVKGDCC